MPASLPKEEVALSRNWWQFVTMSNHKEEGLDWGKSSTVDTRVLIVTALCSSPFHRYGAGKIIGKNNMSEKVGESRTVCSPIPISTKKGLVGTKYAVWNAVWPVATDEGYIKGWPLVLESLDVGSWCGWFHVCRLLMQVIYICWVSIFLLGIWTFGIY